MRYHALVMACLAGVPFAAVAYHPKVATLMGDLGLARLVVQLEDANERGLNRLLKTLLDTEALSPELLVRREALQTKAEQNFLWLAEYCEKQFG